MTATEWEIKHQSENFGKYPKEELVRWAMTTFPTRRGVKVLDIGCGQGASSWFLAREGFSVTSLDASPTAVNRTAKRLKDEGLDCESVLACATKLPFKVSTFDAVVDVASIQHNDSYLIDIIFEEVARILKPRGQLFSVFVSTSSSIEPFAPYKTTYWSEISMHKVLRKGFQNIRSSLSTYYQKPGCKVENWIITAEKK